MSMRPQGSQVSEASVPSRDEEMGGWGLELQGREGKSLEGEKE